jgi:hypothetical protein
MEGWVEAGVSVAVVDSDTRYFGSDRNPMSTWQTDPTSIDRFGVTKHCSVPYSTSATPPQLPRVGRCYQRLGLLLAAGAAVLLTIAVAAAVVVRRRQRWRRQADTATMAGAAADRDVEVPDAKQGPGEAPIAATAASVPERQPAPEAEGRPGHSPAKNTDRAAAGYGKGLLGMHAIRAGWVLCVPRIARIACALLALRGAVWTNMTWFAIHGLPYRRESTSNLAVVQESENSWMEAKAGAREPGEDVGL